MFLTHARPRARLAASALLAAAALALTACGGDAEGQPDPTAAPATSAAAETPTLTPAATPSYKPASADGPAENVPLPKMPTEARLKTQQGLEAFIPYWFALLSYAYETGDLQPLEDSTGPKCFTCDEYAKVIKAWHSNNSWIVGGKVTVEEIEDRYVETTDGSYHPSVLLKQGALQYFEDGKKVDETPGVGKPELFIPSFSYDDGAWRLLDIERPEGLS